MPTIKKNFFYLTRARASRRLSLARADNKKIFFTLLARARVTPSVARACRQLKIFFTLLARARHAVCHVSLTRACRQLKKFFTLLARARHAVCRVSLTRACRQLKKIFYLTRARVTPSDNFFLSSLKSVTVAFSDNFFLHTSVACRPIIFSLSLSLAVKVRHCSFH